MIQDEERNNPELGDYREVEQELRKEAREIREVGDLANYIERHAAVDPKKALEFIKTLPEAVKNGIDQLLARLE
jgi:hypothetical protein